MHTNAKRVKNIYGFGNRPKNIYVYTNRWSDIGKEGENHWGKEILLGTLF